MAGAIDTNVLLRLLVRDNADQVRGAEAFVAKGAWVSHLVLAEAMWVLGSIYGHSPSAIAAALEQLLKQQTLLFQDTDVVIRALALFKAHGKVNFSDCLILEIARKAGHAPVATFDRAFAKLPGVERLSGR